MMNASIFCSSYDSLFDSPLSISACGLPQKQQVTVHAYTVIDNGNRFESLAHYLVNEKGEIDLSCDSSHGGTYKGIEPMGLFWSMKPSPLNKDPYARLTKINVTTPLIVTVSIYKGFINSVESIHSITKSDAIKTCKLAETVLNRWMMSPKVKRIPLTLEKDGIQGALFVPSGKGPFPSVITLFGSYPGTLEFKAALLASRGYVGLALAYVGLPGLPKITEVTELQLEYFEKATDFLISHPKVNKSSGIGVIAISFSSFIALLMGAFFPCVKCVIWINGFHYPMFGRITYKNRLFLEQPVNIDLSDLTFISNKPLIFSRCFHPIYQDPFDKTLNRSLIPFNKRHDVGYMFIAGLSDNNVPSEYYINQIEKILQSSNHPNYKLLRYPGAGHLLETTYSIHHRITPQKIYNVFVDWGGETYPHCKAQEDAWKKQLEFLKSSLTLNINPKL